MAECREAMTANELAQAVGGWSALAAAIAVLGGAMFAGWQLRMAAQQLKLAAEQSKVSAQASRLQAALAVRQLVSSEDVQKARRFAVRELPDDYEPSKLTPEQIDKIERVTLSFQYAGHLLWLGLASEEDIVPDIGLAAIFHWKKLKRWIDFIRQTLPNSRLHFEYLAGQADQFIRSNLDKFITSIPRYDPTEEEVAALIQLVAKQAAQRLGASAGEARG